MLLNIWSSFSGTTQAQLRRAIDGDAGRERRGKGSRAAQGEVARRLREFPIKDEVGGEQEVAVEASGLGWSTLTSIPGTVRLDEGGCGFVVEWEG
jgi:hypothetical protein